MKNIIHSIRTIFLLSVFFCQMSCDTTEMELIKNPNQLSQKQAANRLPLVLNNLELRFKSFIYNMSSNCTPMMRVQWTYLYGDSVFPENVNDIWQAAYADNEGGVISDADFIIEEGTQKKLNYHVGIAKTLKAYTLINLVDFFGDIVYSEANKAPAIREPKLDKGKEVYQAALKMLKEAETLFASGDPGNEKPADIFYNADPKSWIKLIHTLYLKVYLQTRLIDPDTARAEINKIIAKGNYIKTTEEDFQFNYSKNDANPDSRHPYYTRYYAKGFFQRVIGNYWIYILKDQKSIRDPRLRYYLYRQTHTGPTQRDLSKPAPGVKDAHYYLGDGYWGYDHGLRLTVGKIGSKLTGWGIYPVGGAFDDDSFTSIDENPGAGGDGVLPILLSSWVNFMLAEASLTLGTTGDAETYFEQGITQSIEKVQKFGTARGVDLEKLKEKKIALTSLADYLTAAKEEYKKAPLDAIIKEYYIAAFGNAIEPYNNYRRTGYPSDLQKPLEPMRDFPRSSFYPADAVNNNSNISQKKLTAPVFWDTGKTKLY